MRVAALVLLVLAACATVRPPAVARDPQEAALRFLDAVDEGDWESAYRLLSDRWRARLTPERLAADREQGGALAADRLARARLAAGGPPRVEGPRALFPIGEGRALRLVREGGAWRIDALE